MMSHSPLKLLQKLFRYNGKSNDNLKLLRCVKWEQAMMMKNEIDPAIFPPTERATYFHSLRVHFEVIKALKLNIDCGLDPCCWGWQRHTDVLKPIMTDLPPAPDFLLNVVRCNCKTSSRNTCGTTLCSCRKNGLKCVQACGDCRGVACENADTIQIDVSDKDEDVSMIENVV